jgi:hypothetical protein
MQYKVSSIDAMSSPKDGPIIWLWKYDNQGHHKLPSGVPKLVPFHLVWGNDASKSIKEEKIICNGISKYLEFWNLNIVRNEMYGKAMVLNIQKYFRKFIKIISKTKSLFVGGFLAT